MVQESANHEEAKYFQNVQSTRRNMNVVYLERMVYVTCATTCGLLCSLLALLIGFGAIISAVETPQEIKENRIFQSLLNNLTEAGVPEEQIELVAKFSRRDRVRGLEGFSTFDAVREDWTGADTKAFFGATSYTFDLASTIGYGSFTAVTDAGRAVSLVAILICFPVVVVTYTKLADFVYNVLGNRVVQSSAKYKAVVDRYDQEKVGKLDKKELYLIFSDLGLNVTAAETEVILEQYDFMDGDGLLDEEEFRQLCVDLKLKIGILARSTFQLEFAVGAFLIYCAFYTLVTFFAIEELDFFESFYFVMISVSTVGLGDVVPPQNLRPVFSFLSFFGLGFTALLFKAMIDKLYERTDLRKRYFHRALQPVFDKKTGRFSVQLAQKLVPEEDASNPVLDIEPEEEHDKKEKEDGI